MSGPPPVVSLVELAYEAKGSPLTRDEVRERLKEE